MNNTKEPNNDIDKNISYIIGEINHDIWRKSPWCYVKIQALLEKFVRKLLRIKFISIEGQSLKQNLDTLKKYDQNIDINILHKLNHLANKVKHENAETIDFDFDFLKEFCSKFNIIVANTDGILSEFYLDETIFSPPLTINIQPSKTNDFSKNKSEQHNNKNAKSNSYVINCGVGNRDNGFTIYYKKSKSILPSFEKGVYATIFNFLQRSTKVKENLYIKQLEKERNIKINYYRVFRFQMLLLTAIRCGYCFDGKLAICISPQDKEDIELAWSNICHYANMIALLCSTKIETSLIFDNSGATLSLDKEADIYAKDMLELNYSHSTWFASSLVYKTNINSKDILLELLYDFFGYCEFREGQLQAIISSLNTTQNAICVMPTGAGKSIVYYMQALLSPSPTIIIVPTLILGKDQKRNLLELHGIDDCYIYSEHPHKKLQLANKFIYMTPEDLQSYNLVISIIGYNSEYKISNIILDEVHTLCNWSHDFRPDYLMLSKNLFTFVDNCKYLGFTATANYKILSDLVHQMKIDFNNVIQPITFNAGNFTFEFNSCQEEDIAIRTLLGFVEDFISNSENKKTKMVIFTRNQDSSKKLSDALAALDNYDTSCFDAEHTYSYQQFVYGDKRILIADSEMGIGINMPNVVCTLHYGLPNSKAQYVQEIGRANRDLNAAKSIVIFIQRQKLSNSDQKLLRFDTSMDEIVHIINTSKTNLASLFTSFLGAPESYNSSTKEIYNVYNILHNINMYTILEVDKNKKINLQKYLYKLHILGIVDNWYVKFEDESQIIIQVEIDFNNDQIDYIKHKVMAYIGYMGTFGKAENDIVHANSIIEIIYIFEKWFYDEFLRYHREQLLNVVEFFNYYSNNLNSENILSELSSYFKTSIQYIDNSQQYIDELSFEEILSGNFIIDSKLNGISEQLLSNTYDAKKDLICFLYQFNEKRIIEHSRILRIVDSLLESERRVFLEHLYKYYPSICLQGKIDVFNALLNYYSGDNIINSLYNQIPLDEVYMAYLSNIINNTVWRN